MDFTMNRTDFTGMESRSAHPSTAQLESLIQFLEANPDLAKGFSKNPNARAKSNAKWEALSVKLNSIGGTFKNSKKWIKYWSDKKSAVKKKVAIRNNARENTSGGVEIVPDLSDIEERILTLIGGEPALPAPPTITQCAQPGSSSRARQCCCQKNNALEKTGSGVENVPELSDIEERILTLMGGEPTLPTPPTITPHARPGSSSRTRHNAAAKTLHRMTRSALQASHLSQRRSQFISLTEKFLRLEEQRLELDRRMIQVLEQAAERERLTAQANLAVGEGLKALADAINRQRNP